MWTVCLRNSGDFFFLIPTAWVLAPTVWKLLCPQEREDKNRYVGGPLKEKRGKRNLGYLHGPYRLLIISEFFYNDPHIWGETSLLRWPGNFALRL